MWFYDEVLMPRYMKSVLWILGLQFSFINFLIFLVKVISWHPILGITEWFFQVFHWKTLMNHCILCLASFGFSFLHLKYYAVEKEVCLSKLEKICKSLSPYSLQFVILLSVLGGISASSCCTIFNNSSIENRSFIESFITIEENFLHFFVISHGCYTGIIFSLQYFICDLYLLKFSITQETKRRQVRVSILGKLKDSFVSVLKVIHWYYISFIIFAPLFAYVFGFDFGSIDTALYKLINPKSFIAAWIVGSIVYFIWDLYVFLFKIHITERYKFSIEEPLNKVLENQSLCQALTCPDMLLLKYMAALDLRVLAEHEPLRRQQFFAISHPGGHPRQWRFLSNVCLTTLQEFSKTLNEFSAMSSLQSQDIAKKNIQLNRHPDMFQPPAEKKSLKLLDKMQAYFRQMRIVAYFLDEIPSAKVMNLFSSSQPCIWMVEALGALITASYVEDKFGVVQQTLSQIICMLLDVKMAEEKLPISTPGVHANFIDPQSRFNHAHQRILLKLALKKALIEIATAFKNDIEGIHLPEVYQRYFVSYLNQKFDFRKIVS